MRRSTRLLLATATLTLVGSAAVAGPVAAGGPTCAPRTLSKAFLQWGDTNDYFLVDAADFENDGKGTGIEKSWKLPKQAKVVTEQSPWKVNGAGHRKALQIEAQTSVTTPEVCVMVDEEFFRFFYKDPGKPGARLTVTVTATSDLGSITSSGWSTSSSSKGWKVSPPIALPNVRGEDGQQQIRITFTTGNSRADRWVVDDIMIDPWKSR